MWVCVYLPAVSGIRTETLPHPTQDPSLALSVVQTSVSSSLHPLFLLLTLLPLQQAEETDFEEGSPLRITI